MAIHIPRREFLSTLYGVVVAWPLAARAQQAVPVIGFLNNASPEPFAHLVASFRRGLNEAGFVEGQNVSIEYRWARGQYDRLPALAAELARRQVAAIVATGGEPPVLAAKEVTQTIPIVFVVGDDPVALGLADSFNRPGRNATGMAMLAYAAATKRWDLLTELVPSGTSIAVLAKPDSLSSQLELKELQPLWGSRGHQVNILNAANESEIDAGFAKLRGGALFVTTEALWTNRRDQIIALAARYAVPAIYPFREFVVAGGLVSYGFNLADTYRQIGIYTGRILKGEKPADLPVVQPTKFELVINLKTAKALGISVPLTLQVAADEVIE